MRELVSIDSTSFWVKIVEMLQQNWALLELKDNGEVTAYFISDASGVFDDITFASIPEAMLALRRNGFERFVDDPSLADFLTVPATPFHRDSHPNGPIYSSGRFWIS